MLLGPEGRRPIRNHPGTRRPMLLRAPAPRNARSGSSRRSSLPRPAGRLRARRASPDFSRRWRHASDGLTTRIAAWSAGDQLASGVPRRSSLEEMVEDSPLADFPRRHGLPSMRQNVALAAASDRNPTSDRRSGGTYARSRGLDVTRAASSVDAGGHREQSDRRELWPKIDVSSRSYFEKPAVLPSDASGTKRAPRRRHPQKGRGTRTHE